MMGMPVPNRTKYERNVFKCGSIMIFISKFVLESRDYDFSSLQNKFSVIATIFGPF